LVAQIARSVEHFGVRSSTHPYKTITPYIATTISLVVLSIMSYMASGPIFEGYDFVAYFKEHSIFGVYPWAAGRPLTPLVWFISAKIGGLSRLGFFVIYLFHEALRVYAINRLRIRLGQFTIPVIIMAIALPGWGIFTNERYSAAQFALSLSALGVSFYLTGQKWLTTFLMLLALFTYPPSIAFIPLALLMSININDFRRSSWHKLISHTKYLSIPIVSYLVFTEIILRILKVHSYDTQTTRPAIHLLLKYFMTILETLIWRSPFCFFSIVVTLIVVLVLGKNVRWPIYFIAVFFYIIVAELIYAVNYYYIRDRERVFYIAVGSILIFSIMHLYSNSNQAKYTSKNVSRASKLNKIFIFLLMAVCATTFIQSYNTYSFITSNSRSVIQQISLDTKNVKPHTKILLMDATGRYGDVDSLYGVSTLTNIISEGNSFLSGLNYFNSNITFAKICIKAGVKPFTPIADRFPLPPVENCAKIDLHDYDYVYEVENYVKHPIVVKIPEEKIKTILR
jgi:hypothetical protein